MAHIESFIDFVVSYSLFAVTFLIILRCPSVGLGSGVYAGRYAGIVSPLHDPTNSATFPDLWYPALSSTTIILPYLWRRRPGRPVKLSPFARSQRRHSKPPSTSAPNEWNRLRDRVTGAAAGLPLGHRLLRASRPMMCDAASRAVTVWPGLSRIIRRAFF